MLNNLAHRHHRALRKAGKQAAAVQDYEIVDRTHRPDLRGEFAGVKVRNKAGKQVVALTERQARFYIDQGAIAPLLKPEAVGQK